MNIFLLRAIPYLMCVISGIVLFLIDFYLVPDQSYSDLLSGITAGLLSIPIVFLIYDNFNYRIKLRVNEQQAAQLATNINTVVMDILTVFYGAIGGTGNLGIRAVQKMVDMPMPAIRKKLHMGRKDIATLQNLKNRLDTLVYRAGAANVFDTTRFETVMGILRNLSHVVSILEYDAGHSALVKYTQALFDSSDDWLDSNTEKTARAEIQTNNT